MLCIKLYKEFAVWWQSISSDNVERNLGHQEQLSGSYRNVPSMPEKQMRTLGEFIAGGVDEFSNTSSFIPDSYIVSISLPREP